MIDFKAVLKSKTMWGTAISLAATIAQMTGWHLGATDGLAEEIVAVVGSLFAIYGRAVSVTRIIT